MCVCVHMCVCMARTARSKITTKGNYYSVYQYRNGKQQRVKRKMPIMSCTAAVLASFGRIALRLESLCEMCGRVG